MKSNGFTYLEVIAALALIGLTVVAASSMTAAHPTASARLDAQEEMVKTLDAVLEAVRGGVIQPKSGPVDPPISIHLPVSVWLEVSESELPGFYWIRATASAPVRGRVVERSLSTAIWSP